jgi:hypothetical protein
MARLPPVGRRSLTIVTASGANSSARGASAGRLYFFSTPSSSIQGQKLLGFLVVVAFLITVILMGGTSQVRVSISSVIFRCAFCYFLSVGKSSTNQGQLLEGFRVVAAFLMIVILMTVPLSR